MVEEIQNQMNKLSIIHDNCYNFHTFSEIINMTLTKNRGREYVEILSKCQCCERHQVNRPTTLVENYTDYPQNTYGENCYCNCKCRHYCRLLNYSFS